MNRDGDGEIKIKFDNDGSESGYINTSNVWVLDTESASTEPTVVVSGAGIACINGTYTLDASADHTKWKKETGEYMHSVYDSDWGWIISDSRNTYQYFSDPNGP
eukprot:COSAG04_NODE_17959_length_455_cov_0.710674_2_plen_103_part_01